MPIRLPVYVSSITSHRLLLYGAISSGAVAAVISNALDKHNNFYSIAVYLSRSNGAVVVLANFTVFLALLWGRLLQQIFFGPLRPMEVERLYDRMWFFVTESLLAFTIFRDEFDTPFALWFGLVLFTKCFHWLLSDRVEWMDQRPYPGPPISFHIRVLTLFAILWMVDIIAFLLTIEYMLTFGIGGTVLFTSEYAILIASLTNSFAKYCLSLVDLRRASLRGGENAPPWEDKSMLVFYVELATDFLKLVTYLTFFMIVLAFYGLPLNIVRDVYITARSFIMRLRDLMRYRTATRNMDERYPNATEAELNGMSDKTCIICRDEMVAGSNPRPDGGVEGQNQPVAQEGPNTTPKKLPCGHIFHFYCLRSWLERQQSCPTCRRSVLDPDPPARANGQIPPPLARPGAVPQAANMGAMNAQQWGQQQAPNNPMGFLGRLMGAAGVPPAMPPVQNGPAMQPVANGVAWEGQQPHGQQGQLPVYRPPFVYQGPQPQYFAQPQRFQGFWAPDGVWHPWPQFPAAQPLNERRPEVPAQNTSTGDEEAPTANSSNTSNIGEGREAGPSSSTTLSAREATAAAALRRMNPSSSQQVPGVSAQPLTPTPTVNTTGNSQSTDTSARPMSPTETPRQIHAPALIPLSDLGARPRGFYGSPVMRTAGGPNGYAFPAEGYNDLRDIRALPEQLTNEQLTRLDRLTRDALDERLRILENVQMTTERCIEELLKCRSMLPRDPCEPLSQDYYPAGTSSQPTPGAQGANGSNNTQDSDRRADNEQPPNQEVEAAF